MQPQLAFICTARQGYQLKIPNSLALEETIKARDVVSVEEIFIKDPSYQYRVSPTAPWENWPEFGKE